MEPRFAQLPTALKDRTLITRVADDVPVLLAHPEPAWHAAGASPQPAPVMLWFHGRTVNKELDPGRYLRWVRAGIAACAVDLPGHGERFIEGWGESDHTLKVASLAAQEINAIVRALEELRFNRAFDTSRIGIGGMSAGGMVTLSRLCHNHSFKCAAVESTAGDFGPMADMPFAVEPYFSDLNPITRLENWQPIPLLALHSEADEWVPVQAIRNFTQELKNRYTAQGVDAQSITLKTWERTGAPNEHSGFGKVSNEAKTTQVEFLARHLLG